jgi:hypothetical protein
MRRFRLVSLLFAVACTPAQLLLPAGRREPLRAPEPDPALADLTAHVRRKIRGNTLNKFKSSFNEENDRVVAEQLGFCTVEQEADELALELLADLGIDPAVSGEALLEFGAVWESEDGGPPASALSVGECRTLQANGWKDAAGEDVVVPVGDLGDPHHSPCFRAFNIAREIEAHDFDVDDTNRPTPPGGSWEKVIGDLD